MKILLINSPYVFADPENRRLEPLGIEYLTSSLKKAGHDVTLWDSTLKPPMQADDLHYYYGPDEETIEYKV